jgi:hypothetical protein
VGKALGTFESSGPGRDTGTEPASCASGREKLSGAAGSQYDHTVPTSVENLPWYGVSLPTQSCRRLAGSAPHSILDPPLNSYLKPSFAFPSQYPLCERDREQSVFFMSSTGQGTSSLSNVQLIVDALADYSKETGIDLSEHPIAVAFEQSSSSGAILQLFHQRERAFKEYQDGSRRLISYLSQALKVLQSFLGILGGAVSLVVIHAVW